MFSIGVLLSFCFIFYQLELIVAYKSFANIKEATAWKVSKYELEKTPYLDTFRAVSVYIDINEMFTSFK